MTTDRASSPCPPTSLRRAQSSGTVLALLVGVGLVMLVIGYLIGRVGPGTTPIGPPPVAPDATPDSDGALTANSGSDTATPADKPGMPPIVFEPPVLDFGLIDPDAELSGKILVRNVSKEPLRIAAMRPSCKCTTVVDFTGAIIPPGQALPITAVMEPRTATGVKNAAIRFKFDGYEEIAEVKIMSVIAQAVYATPPDIEMSNGLKGTLTLQAEDGEPFRVLAVNGAPPVFADEFDPATDSPRSLYEMPWDLSVYDQETCLDANGNRMPVYLVYETDHIGAPIIAVHVRHVPCSVPELPQPGQEWMLSSLHTVIPVIADGETAEFEVFLRWINQSRTPTDTIKEVISESEDFTAELLEVRREGAKITCRVAVTPSPGHRGLLMGDVRFFSYSGHSRPITVIGSARDDAPRTSMRTAE